MTPRKLYLPGKYRVALGSGRFGFCTVWSDPDIVLRQSPDITAAAAIVGTLYSREGVNVILRNLALNPDISHLFLWGNAPLSLTPFGLAGKNILAALWDKGCNADGKVSGTSFALHKEFEMETIKAVTANVELVDVSGKSLGEAVEEMKKVTAKTPYMSPKEFPEHKPAEGEPFPSEKTGFVVRERKIFDTWLKVVDRVMRYGVVKETEYGNKQREIIAINWVIEDETTAAPHFPGLPDEVRSVIGLDREAIEKYYPEFMSAELPPGTSYTYGQRLWAYGQENGNAVSQIDNIIGHLKESAVTRRAVATTWNQYIDASKNTKNPPCFVAMQVIQTDGKLHLLATFRSHDIFKAAIPNAFGLRKLQERIAGATGFNVGSLAITSNSAHIYEEDWEQARKLLKCAIWEREPSLVFNQDTDSDPRGLVLITVKDGNIVADFATPDGATLITIEGRTAKQVYKKIAQLDLLSRPDHMFDVGAELQKAEIAKDLNIPYSQDKPLTLPRNINQ